MQEWPLMNCKTRASSPSRWLLSDLAIFSKSDCSGMVKATPELYTTAAASFLSFAMKSTESLRKYPNFLPMTPFFGSVFSN